MTADLRAYASSRDSGVPWLGRVPSEWSLRRGKWLFRKMERPLRDSDEVVTCFRDGIVTLRSNRRTTGFTESIKEIGYQGIRRGDLVVHAMDGFAGAIGVSDSDGKGSPVYSVCEPKPEADSHYYAYLLREMARAGWIAALAKGVRERSTDFRFAAFASQCYPLPPLPEQAAIVRYLDYMDRRIRRYIRAKQKLIKLLEEEKQAIIHRAVTGQIDVRTGKPYPAYKPSGVEWLVDIPEGWRALPLKRWVSTKITDGPHETPRWSAKGVPFLSAEAMVDGRLDFTRRRGFISRELHDLYCRKCRPEKDDIFMCKSGATTGKTAIVDTNEEFSVWSPLARIRADPERVLPRMLFLALQSRYVQREVQETWSYGTQPNLSMGAMERLVVAFPQIGEQHEIVSRLTEAVERHADSIDLIRRGISLIRELRTRLIADVVTGKLDVREAAASLPAEPEESETTEEEEAMPGLDDDSDDQMEDGLNEEEA